LTQKSEELAIEEKISSAESRIKYKLLDMPGYMSSVSWELGVDNELAMVDKRMKELVASSQKILTDVALHVVNSGGKRLRPTLAILSHHALQGNNMERLVDIAAAMELIHSATLVHDDINDGADLRRGKRAAYKQFGMHEAIVAGDFMFARAFYVGGGFEKKIIELVAECCTHLAEGEIRQYAHRGDIELSVDQYLKIIRGKTAHPIKAAALIGASLADGSSEDIRALGEYGLNVGMAFQIVDDILDVIGDEQQLGKMTGSDIREGNMTLPVIIAREKDDGIARSLQDVLGAKALDASEIDRFLEMVRESGGVEQSLEIARRYSKDSIKYLESIPDSDHKNRLRELARLIVERSA